METGDCSGAHQQTRDDADDAAKVRECGNSVDEADLVDAEEVEHTPQQEDDDAARDQAVVVGARGAPVDLGPGVGARCELHTPRRTRVNKAISEASRVEACVSVRGRRAGADGDAGLQAHGEAIGEGGVACRVAEEIEPPGDVARLAGRQTCMVGQAMRAAERTKAAWDSGTTCVATRRHEWVVKECCDSDAGTWAAQW